MWPTPRVAYLLLLARAAMLAGASPIEVEAVPGPIEERQSCPGVHVFGARETTASPGYGSSDTVVNDVLAAYSGSTAEAISYPACGGQSSCGDVSYSSSVAQGIAAVASAVNSFNSKCPSTQLVLVGYSQGGEIMDVALCGGGDSNQGYTNTAVQLSASAVNMVKAAIFMGDPLFRAGLSYEVGTCEAGGFDERPAGFSCPSASKIQSYCDSSDPYCCNGSNAATHQGYGAEYGSQALAFIKTKLSSSTSSPSPAPAPAPSPSSPAPSSPAPAPSTGGSCSALYGQCGGIGWTGATCCASGSSCKEYSAYYSQCLS